MSAIRNTGPAGTDRPRLTARSVLASTLLGLDPPQLRTNALVAGAELLGITPGTARVAISRMVANGELASTGDGYRLAGHLLARHARQTQSVAGPPEAWDGTWRTSLVPADPRPAPQRAALRRAMVALRHAELREGAWLRPDNLPAGALPDAEAVAAAATVTLAGQLRDDGSALVGRLWDLEAWDLGARELLIEIDPLADRLSRSDTTALADSFVVAAAALRHLQADPLLPPALLPRRWHGEELRQAQDRFEQAFRALLRDWHLARG